MILVADCTPVLLADANAGIICALHAGRRGFLSGIVERGLDLMVRSGAKVESIRAAIGPRIMGTCYEVDEVMAHEAWQQYPACEALTHRGTPGIDIGNGVMSILNTAGITGLTVVNRCTRCDDDFFSHRRDGAKTGRCAGIIGLVE
jgi:YfiH family protein